MHDYLPLLAGTAFALAGFLLLILQTVIYDLMLSYRRLVADIEASVGHDTNIFPDQITWKITL